MRQLVLLSCSVVAIAASGCAHSPLSPSALDSTRRVAFIARIDDGAGPRSTVFRDDSTYRPKLAPRRIDDKEADRRLALVLTNGTRDDARRGTKVSRTIGRFEIADSLRANTISLLPQTHPWTDIVNPASVARMLESFLVQEVPANAPDYERLRPLGADTVVEFVIEDFGMRSDSGRCGAYLSGYARMFRISGAELYRRKFTADDVSAKVETIDPFAVAKDASLFAERMRRLIVGVARQIADDLNVSPIHQAKPVPIDVTAPLPDAETGKETDTQDDPL